MPEKGILLVISGPSGSGKGTVAANLASTHPRMKISVSATTRNIRPGETDGIHYYFMSVDLFKEMLDRDEFLEWASIYGYFYGTPAGPVRDLIAGGYDVILDIDVQGGLQVKKRFPDAVMVFLLPPSRTVLEERLKGRGTDSPGEISKRLLWVDTELGYLKRYDYVVINDRIESTLDMVESIVKAERSRSLRFALEGW